MKRKSIVDTLPVAIGILVSWCMYVLLLDTFNINQVVEGNPSRLAFLILLTYLLTLTLIFNFQIFRIAACVYIIIVLIMVVMNEQLYISSDLLMIILGCLLGVLGYVVERIASYFLVTVKKG